MKVKDIVYYAAVACGKEDFAQVLKKGSVPDDNADAVKMLDSYNLTVMELSEEAEPLIFSESITSADGRIYFRTLQKVAKKITDVWVNGVKAPFTVYPEYLETRAGEVVVRYEFRAEKATSLDDDCVYGEDMSARTIAYGVAAEYMLGAGLYDEARTLRSRYERAITSRALKRKKTIKARTWA